MTVAGQTQGSQDSAEDGSGGGSEPPEQTQQRITTLNNNNNYRSNTLPPEYPCSDVCVHCGKKVTELGVSSVENQSTEEVNDCSCECHKQLNHPLAEPFIATQGLQQNPPVQSSVGVGASVQGLPPHIPPGGPDCLPGCGYSGLPCYNCSLRPVPSQRPNNLTNVAPAVPQNAIPSTFIPHVFTVELQDDMTGSNVHGNADQEHVILQNEEDPRNKKRRRTCLSILIAVIAVNVAFQMFKLL
ncbi:uncharacterized protein LOC122256200 [Penaeus japonicus]|uniref:uncharacterized protein LOC122256200 n=1 Tax=Penaeus japonicus TaxID=27405 RepID=UPI001C7166AB|nr:uncharacterized protein LOC122256200 [Penaeus japonicus]XP_042876637.1 uncharacterized protein LOC122256200 [Penaeus japonicus]XP_042876639.1 uncharacterized protein LOC122256200 [Penaeus japonicus]